MIASVITPLAVAVSINVILYIYASTASLLQKTRRDISAGYLDSKIRLRDDVIVQILLILNWIFGYLALLPTTSYFAQPFLCFLCVILGFTLFFIYIICKPFTYLGAYMKSTKSGKLTTAASKGEKQSKRLDNDQHVFYIGKTQDSKENVDEKELGDSNGQPIFHKRKAHDSMRRENEYVNPGDRPPLHVEEWYRHSKKLTDYEIPRARVSSFHSSFHSSSSSDRSSSVVSNGRRSTYFNPNSVPMSQIEHNRFAKFVKMEDDGKEAYGYGNGGFEEDYF